MEMMRKWSSSFTHTRKVCKKKEVFKRKTILELEDLLRVVVNAASGGPMLAGEGLLQEAVALLEEEMVLDQLILHIFGHPVQLVIGAFQLFILLQSVKSLLDFLLHYEIIATGQQWVEGISVLK
jgi:hypothetical protein